MKLIVRLLAMLLVVPATFLFTYWVPFAFIPFIEQRWVPDVISLLCALGAGWFTWKWLSRMPEGLISSTLFGAVVVGAIGFCTGFFGPIFFDPEVNQGPLLGMLITGPLGFVLGGVGGFVYWMVKGKKVLQKEYTI